MKTLKEMEHQKKDNKNIEAIDLNEKKKDLILQNKKTQQQQQQQQ